MPMFEFECTDCNHRFEELVFSSSKVVDKCPKCEGSKIKKLVSAGAIRSESSSPSAGCGSSAPACSVGGG